VAKFAFDTDSTEHFISNDFDVDTKHYSSANAPTNQVWHHTAHQFTDSSHNLNHVTTDINADSITQYTDNHATDSPDEAL
jgi:hypothetical protein